MSRFRTQHELAVSLLEELGLQYLRLEQTPYGYRYYGWKLPRTEDNGSGRQISRHGVIRCDQIR